MFTGLIKDLGQIQKIEKNLEGQNFWIKTKLINDIQIDDSVAVNGVCLTAVEKNADCFRAQAIHMTLEKSSLGQLTEQSVVNLELALKANERLGGHFVQGHVNTTGILTATKNVGDNYELTFEIPQDNLKYIIAEGSIAIDGISLTVARLKDQFVTVAIIPHTWANTNLSTVKLGDKVNIEVDLLAKYLERFMLFQKNSNSAGPLC
ncbi:MAG: riboflavin synthase [Bacteriovoracaceae bacterium]|nr:riboflavin synthase [Bacteriovoracaceae bacterium]